MRAMTPLAAVTNAARSDNLPADNGAPRLLANKLASAGMLALAGGELVGDKMKTAPTASFRQAWLRASLPEAKRTSRMNPNEPTSLIESDVPVFSCTSHRHH